MQQDAPSWIERAQYLGNQFSDRSRNADEHDPFVASRSPDEIVSPAADNAVIKLVSRMKTRL